jgi:hypothetical protein
MHTTIAQNQAHRADLVWTKTTGRRFTVNGEHYTSEYTNMFNGQSIRKDWRMTGCDWVIFNDRDEVVGRAHSLTYAKFRAALTA